MRKAVILAAGRGTRMGSHTSSLPKPMIPIRGKPLLERILDRLRQAGTAQAFVVTGYKAGMIESHFAGYPMEITFQRQANIDGTARATLLAREWADGEAFLMTYGDILAEASEYRAMTAALEGDPEADAVVAAKWVEDPWQGAAVYAGNGRVLRIVEKPAPGTSGTHWNSAGIYAFRPCIFKELERTPVSPRGEYELTSAVAQLLASGSKLLLHAVEGGWRDIGRPEDIEAASSLAD